MKLYNNGYLVKGLFRREWSSTEESYQGVGSFVAWPLAYFDDDKSIALENEAFDRWFIYRDRIWLVPDRDYLERYVRHCSSRGFGTQVIQFETPRSNQIAKDVLDVVEVLGFDCIIGYDTSYLDMDPDGVPDLERLFQKLNRNRLFDTIEETYEFLDIYNRLLDEGENLEHGENPTPALLSIVRLD